MTGSDRTAGHIYVELIAGQLTEERAAKNSLEQRAASGVTWAGGLVAASLALLSTISGNPVATGFVLLGAALLAAAAFFGTRVITPRDYQEAELGKLKSIIANPDLMRAGEHDALWRSAEQAIEILEAARGVNGGKAKTLRIELRFLAGGTASLALAVAAIVVDGWIK